MFQEEAARTNLMSFEDNELVLTEEITIDLNVESVKGESFISC